MIFIECVEFEVSAGHQDGSVQEIVENLDVELRGKTRGRKYSFGIIFIVVRK